MNLIKKTFLIAVTMFAVSCSSNNSDCPLSSPFCGGTFPLNQQATTTYGPAWADITTSASNWITCKGPYALCYYANCTAKAGTGGTVADCPCFETFGTNYVDINAILNNTVYNETLAFCTADPDACHEPNQAPVCASLQSGDFMQGADNFSTFSFYRSTDEPIGLTDCTSEPGLYAGCMTAPCFNPTSAGADDTTMITCQCPVYNGPFQVGIDNASCSESPMIYSAAYNTAPPPPSSKCDLLTSCVPDAPEEDCGCPLETPGVTVIPSDSDVNCTTVCEEYNTCFGTGATTTGIQVGYTCDDTLCTSNNSELLVTSCNGLQNCDISEIFKAESAAGCSCCASQLCDCTANTATLNKLQLINATQPSGTTQCSANGTLCGS